MYWREMGTKICMLALIVMVGAVLLIGSGCAKKSVKVLGKAPLPAEQIKEAPSGPTSGGPCSTNATVGEQAIPGEAQPSSAFGKTISEGRTDAPMLPVYFDFDHFNIRKDMKARIEGDAEFLLDHPEIRVEIQGNCDERGTNEYNLALGERRTKSARAYLVNMGVNPDRIKAVSFGEERPLDPGHNKAAWAKNRRDDFVVIK
ncbi:MAG: peptidoglycan-associated lipoprotein Pal [Nitrospiraceae bacterium]|nr:peptidoglycan-associated lipoprotein Pal [Nitrospiraceae bacterium]